tara:strand:+ start:340 stop:1059 length:720 start_codon:yes stop_codon:yes gene_type:complete
MIDDLQPIIIVGAPGGGTSFFTKFLRAHGFFAGASIEKGREIHDHLGYLGRRKWHESIEMSNINKSILDVMKLPKHESVIQGGHVPMLEQLKNYDDQWWNEFVEINFDEFEPVLRSEFLFDERDKYPYGFKDPRTIYTLPFWKKVFPNSLTYTVERHSNPLPSDQGPEGQNFTSYGTNRQFRDLFYSHQDDYRFQFEDFTNVEEVNKLLSSLNLETYSSEAELRASLKKLQFQFFKIGE